MHVRNRNPISHPLKFSFLFNDLNGLLGGSKGSSADQSDDMNEVDKRGNEGRPPPHDDHLTPAERRYIEQRERIDMRRLAKTSDKSHRDRILDFNQYLANLSEHYDIPKVGPG